MFFTKENLVNLKYIIILYPLLLLTGPFVPDLILSLISLFYIIYITGNKDWKDFFKKKYNKIFFILYLIMIISSLLSDYKLYSLKTSILYIRFIFFLNVIICIYKNDKDLFRNFCKINFFTLLFVSFDTIFQFYTGYNIIGLESRNEVRMGSFFGDELIVGSFLSRLFPFLIIYLFFFNQNIKILIKFAIIFFVAIAIFLSGERTSFLYFLISFFSMFFIIKNKKLLIILSIVTLLISTYIFKKNINIYNRMVVQTFNQIYDIKSNNLFFFSKEHTVLSKISIKMFKENKILGVGPKNFRNVCYDNHEKYQFLKEYKPDHYCSTHPHNIFFQFLSETGTIGTIFYLFFFCCYGYKIFTRNIKKSKEHKINFLVNFCDYINFPTCSIRTIF